MIHLTGHNYNARDIIRNIFSPLVGVACSSLADEVCQRNNVSFVELVQPFAKLQNDSHFRDVSGTVVSVRGLRLNFCELDWRPPQTLLARKMLSDSVSSVSNERNKSITIGQINLEVPHSEPWFEQWRETFLTVQFPSDHEFTRHLLACVIVLSSGDPAIVETAQRITQQVLQMQNMTPQKLPKWFVPTNTLNSYVVLHEGSEGDISKVQQEYEMLKSTFPNNKCFLIQVNSLNNSETVAVPDYWSPYIKRQPKNDAAQSGPVSEPKTPQDSISTIQMPLVSTSTDDVYTESELPAFHPLSLLPKQTTESIKSKLSISSESIVSQTINPNVWGQERDVDAPHGQCLNAADVENIRHFVQDYSMRALIPYVENLVAILSEAVTNKKGVSKSLLSATKRWFATSKPGAGTSSQNAVIYTSESLELQTRKLGDLYFMFGHYNLAFQSYHQAKKDFNADSAWQYYAGALEMAALSAFMLGTSNRKTYDYMEDAIVCYLNVCKLQQFATRATLLSVECLKSCRLYEEAAKQLTRMTSEESDLRSALLLEQAAYCFLATQPIMYRKYAFHIVLAGNRYSRASQRKHAHRCYKQAYQIFEKRNWSLAEDHIQYTMAKQALILKRHDEASQSFAYLLRPGSQQSTQQQIVFLKEFIQTQNELNQSQDSGQRLCHHAIPHIVQDSVRVLTSPHDSLHTNPLYVPANNISIKYDFKDESTWHSIEEMIAVTAASNKAFVFKPSCNLFSRENLTTDNPLAVQGEPIEIAVTILNTVRCSIDLNDIDLVWKLELDNTDELSNLSLYDSSSPNEVSSNTTAVKAAVKSVPQSTTLEELAEKTLYFRLTPKMSGCLHIMGIVCRVALTVEPVLGLLGMLRFEPQILKQTKNKKPSNQTLFDKKLAIKVLPQVPSLAVCFSTVPTNLLVGEIIPVSILLRNTGIYPIEEIFVGCDTPRWINFLNIEQESPLSFLNHPEKFIKDKEKRKQSVSRLLSKQELKAQDDTTIQMWIQAPYEEGEFNLRLLFYYGSGSTANQTNASPLKYRLVRHTWQFNVHRGIHSETSLAMSNSLTGDHALNIRIRNDNAPHRSIAAEFSINSISLYSTNYRLTDKFYYLDQVEIENVKQEESFLKALKTISFHCPLKSINGMDKSTEATIAGLTHIKINETANKEHHSSSPDLYSFLAKHEAAYLALKNNTVEETAINELKQEKHHTVVIDWKTLIQDSTSKRVSFGQHFLQLQDPSQLGNKNWDIARENNDECLDAIGELNDDNFADNDVWEINNSFVANRCLLEEEVVC